MTVYYWGYGGMNGISIVCMVIVLGFLFPLKIFPPIEPPCIERYARGYETMATQLLGSLLLDCVIMRITPHNIGGCLPNTGTSYGRLPLNRTRRTRYIILLMIPVPCRYPIGPCLLLLLLGAWYSGTPRNPEPFL
jgi:hypothetical protein